MTPTCDPVEWEDADSERLRDRERDERREQRIEWDGPEGLLARKVVSRFTGENDFHD